MYELFLKTRSGLNWIVKNRYWLTLIAVGNIVAIAVPEIISFTMTMTAFSTTTAGQYVATSYTSPRNLSWTYSQLLMFVAMVLLQILIQLLAAHLGWRISRLRTADHPSLFMKSWAFCAVTAGLTCVIPIMVNSYLELRNAAVGLESVRTAWWLAWGVYSIFAPALFAVYSVRRLNHQVSRRYRVNSNAIVPECGTPVQRPTDQHLGT